MVIMTIAVAEAAAATGVNKSTVTRSTRRAREVCQHAHDLIRGTKLDTGATLDRPVTLSWCDKSVTKEKRLTVEVP